jgi:hypothetical protein
MPTQIGFKKGSLSQVNYIKMKLGMHFEYLGSPSDFVFIERPEEPPVSVTYEEALGYLEKGSRISKNPLEPDRYLVYSSLTPQWLPFDTLNVDERT